MILKIKSKTKVNPAEIALWLPSSEGTWGSSVSAVRRPCFRKTTSCLWMRVTREDTWALLTKGWPSMAIHSYVGNKKQRDIPASRVEIVDDDTLELLTYDL